MHVLRVPKTSSLCIQALAKGITESKLRLTASRNVLQAWKFALQKQHCELDIDNMLCPHNAKSSLCFEGVRTTFSPQVFLPLWDTRAIFFNKDFLKLPVENFYNMLVPCNKSWDKERLSILLSDCLKQPVAFGGMLPATQDRANPKFY